MEVELYVIKNVICAEGTFVSGRFYLCSLEETTKFAFVIKRCTCNNLVFV